MSNSKHGGPTFEAPTEWRRIIMEESADGQPRLVAVEEVAGEGPADAQNTSTQEVPSEMPQEWHDILQSTGNSGISLQNEGLDPAEHTIPGMEIPQLYDDDLESTNSGYSIAGNDFSTPERTTVGAPPPPPPGYEEEFPFAAEPQATPPPAQPRNPPLIVPQPQGGESFPPPPSVLKPESYPSDGGTPVSLPAHQSAPPEDNPIPQTTVEMDVPPEPEQVREESTNEIDAHYAESEDYLDASDIELLDDVDEDTGAYNQIIPLGEEELAGSQYDMAAATPLPASATPEPMAAPAADPTPMLEELLAMQHMALEQSDLLAERIAIQQSEAEERDDKLISLIEVQSSDLASCLRSLGDLSSNLNADREEQRFRALQGVFQDLLLLYDFIDLRVRSVWEQRGQDDPMTHELTSVRDRLVELLERQELHPIEITDPEFDPSSQRALQEVITSDPQLDGHISRIFRQGFRYKDRVFRPSEVEVKRYPS